MNAVLDTYLGLSRALTTDPLLLLASVVATFDPLWSVSDDLDGEEDPLDTTLRVVRRAFPDLYAEMVGTLWVGANYRDLERLLCAGISAKGIPLDDLHWVGWGIPLIAHGLDISDPDFYTLHADLADALTPFGICPLDEGDDLPDGVYTVGRAIAGSLTEETNPVLQQVGWLYGWLFSCTGNSLVDETEEVLCELAPLSWSPDDIAFAVEIIAEADTILRDACAGLAALQTHPNLLTVLQDNIDRLRQGTRDGQSPVLEWPSAVGGADRSPQPDPELLLVRRNAA